MEDKELAHRVMKNVLAMARGTLVVDESVLELAGPLWEKNIHIITPEPGEKDEQILTRLLPKPA